MSNFANGIIIACLVVGVGILAINGIAAATRYYDARTDKYVEACVRSGNTFGSCYSIIKNGNFGQFSQQ